jgi:hypothetical protein
MTRFLGSSYFMDVSSGRSYFRACVVGGLRLALGDVVAVEASKSVFWGRRTLSVGLTEFTTY